MKEEFEIQTTFNELSVENTVWGGDEDVQDTDNTTE